MSNDYYNDRVGEFAKQYLSLSFDEIHQHSAHHLRATLKKLSASAYSTRFHHHFRLG